MMSQLDLGSDEGEDHFMKMMQGMMSTLLSKEVLYPSLVDLCKQVSARQQQILSPEKVCVGQNTYLTGRGRRRTL